MALNWEKYDIKVRNDETIKSNQILFNFMQWTFNRLDELCLREICLLIDAIMKDQLREKSAAEIEKLNRKKVQRQKKEDTSKPSLKKDVLWIRKSKQVEQQVIPPIKFLICTFYILAKQEVLKRKIL